MGSPLSGGRQVPPPAGGRAAGAVHMLTPSERDADRCLPATPVPGGARSNQSLPAPSTGAGPSGAGK